ncbi:MAG: transketolase family protein [Planctomycetota bacterium]
MVATREAYGRALLEAGRRDSNIVVLDADLSKSTQTQYFAKEFPERFYQMGIAEANMIDVACGLALSGKKPFVSTFAIFGTGKGWEQIRTIVARSNAPVRLCLSHCGISVGEDGSSAQANEDIGIMRVIPNLKVIVPVDAVETRKVIEYLAGDIKFPVYVRLSRNKWPVILKDDYSFEIGKVHILQKGEDIAIFSYGQTLSFSYLAAQEIAQKYGVSFSIINVSSIKPIDIDGIIKVSKNSKVVVVIEEHSIYCGLGEMIARILLLNGIYKKFEHIGINDVFGESASAEELLEKHQLSKNAINNILIRIIEKELRN